MNKLIFFIVLIFALFGAYTTSIIIHEFVHASDFKFIENNGTRIYVLATHPSDPLGILKHGGYHSGISSEQLKNKTLTDKISEVGRESELKAYSIQGAFLFFCVIIFIIFIKSQTNQINQTNLNKWETEYKN